MRFPFKESAQAICAQYLQQPDEHIPVILADEPSGNLDSVNGEEVMKLLSQLNEEGTTIVMVTHSPYDANYAHRIINLFDGKVVTENIKEHFHI